MMKDYTFGFAGTGMLILTLLAGCRNEGEPPRKYIESVNKWHQQRVDSLTRDDSWLSLAGLYWLDKGKNRFGSDPSNAIIFPGGKAPGSLGTFTLESSGVTVAIDPGYEVTAGGEPVRRIAIQSDATGDPTILHYGSLSWYVIERSGRYAVRLKDAENDQLTNFTRIERFPVDIEWRVEAQYHPFESARTMEIPTVTGEPATMRIPGTLTFEMNGYQYEMLATQDDAEDDEFFVIFSDKTNGESTYGGGRYLYVAVPEDNGKTYIDFNKAYNPPCVFNSYATCPLPPQDNRLDLAVTAGEKMYETSQ